MAKIAVMAVVAAGLAAASPVAPSGADGNEAPGAPAAYRSLSAGDGFACAILDDGSVRCWGRNDKGQLGQGDQRDRGDEAGEMGGDLTPVALGTGRTAVALAGGARHVCAILDNATVKCWGDNNGGQLGVGDISPRGDGPGEMGDNLPVAALGTGRTATAITVGGSHSCALLDNGTVKCWGGNLTSGVLGHPNGNVGDNPNEMGDNLSTVDLGTGRTATAISAGSAHTCVILDNAMVKCWGNNSSGQLGIASNLNRGDNAGEMGDNLPFTLLGTGRTATTISVGGSHSCAILDNSTLRCWGANSNGQLGLGDTANRGTIAANSGDNIPTIPLGTGRTPVAVSLGNSHTCAVLDNAALKCWGKNDRGQLGLGDNATRGELPGEMGDALPAVDLGPGRTPLVSTASATGSCARLDEGSYRCWGAELNGGLGHGTTMDWGDEPGEMGAALPPTPLTGRGLAGRVTDSSSGALLPGTMLAVLSSDDFTLVDATLANGNGDYSVELPSDSYFLYVIDPTAEHASGIPGPLATVTSGMTTVNVSLVTTRGAIAGSITDETTHAALGGAWAIVLNGSTGAPERGVVANGSGQFTIPGLRVGTHFVAQIDPSGAHGVEFHPDATSVPTATPIAVSAGATANADGDLPPLTPAGGGAALTGQVTNDSPQNPLAGVFVVALRADTFAFVRATVTNSSGRYTLLAPPGVGYKLLFLDSAGLYLAEWNANHPSSALDLADTVTAPAVTNAALRRGSGTISGTITASGGAPLEDSWAIAIGPTGVAGADVVDEDGDFLLTGLAGGAYRLAILDPNAIAVEFWHDGTDYATATQFAVAPGDTTVIDEELGP